jgi:hypothetical protein
MFKAANGEYHIHMYVCLHSTLPKSCTFEFGGKKILTDHSLVLLVVSIPAMAPETIPKEDISNWVQGGTPPVVNWM